MTEFGRVCAGGWKLNWRQPSRRFQFTRQVLREASPELADARVSPQSVPETFTITTPSKSKILIGRVDVSPFTRRLVCGTKSLQTVPVSWCSLWKGGFGTNPPSGGPAESINKSTHLCKNLCKNLCSRSVATARARASAPLRPASGASEDNLSGCHRPARPFRRAP